MISFPTKNNDDTNDLADVCPFNSGDNRTAGLNSPMVLIPTCILQDRQCQSLLSNFGVCKKSWQARTPLSYATTASLYPERSHIALGRRSRIFWLSTIIEATL